MESVGNQDVKSVVEQIIALKRSAQIKSIDGRTTPNTINLSEKCKSVLKGNDQFDLDAWTQLTEDEQIAVRSELVGILDSLKTAPKTTAAPNEPVNIISDLSPPDSPTIGAPDNKVGTLSPPPSPGPQHVMYATYASTRAIYACAAYGGVFIVTLLCLIGLLWDNALNVEYAARINKATAAITILEEASKNATDTESDTSETKDAAEKQQTKEHAQQTASVAAIAAITAIKENKGASESTVLQMIILLGALGGSLHLLGSLVNYVGERKLKRSWLLYYFSLPLVGAALAPIVYMLLRVGILTPTGQGNGGAAIANLNLISIYAFAALTGMFAKIATEKLGDVFAAMFQPRPERTKSDTLDPDRPTGTMETAKPKL